jgi:glycosyltransferase involved in cell wall biosynthesis
MSDNAVSRNESKTMILESQQPTQTKPLLTIAIPTYNRARFLKENLDTLFDQLLAEERVELIVSDNACTDETPALIEGYRQRGLRLRYLRNEANLGPDGNILQCFEQARGKYVWVFGDDDILVPGGVAKILALLAEGDYGLAFVTPFAFHSDYIAEKTSDRFGRHAESLPGAVPFARRAGQLIMFISAMIVNKDLYSSIPHRDLRALVGSCLVQLGWLFPVLAVSSRNLVVFDKVIGQRIENGSGWGPCQVFGVNLMQILDDFLHDRKDIAREIQKALLQGWLPHMVMGIRRGTAGPLDVENMHRVLEPVHRKSWRYWLFVYPLIALPLAPAVAWHSITIQAARLKPSRVREFLSVRYAHWRSRAAIGSGPVSRM